MNVAKSVLVLALLTCAHAASLYKDGDVAARYTGHAPSPSVLTLENGRWAVIGSNEYLAVDSALCDDMNCDVLGSLSVALPSCSKLRTSSTQAKKCC